MELTNRQKADLAALPALILGGILNKKHYDSTGSWWGLKGYGPIFRQNKIVSAAYLIAFGTQLYFIARNVKDEADRVNAMEALVEDNNIRLYEPSSEPISPRQSGDLKLVKADGAETSIRVCTDAGHGGEEVQMHEGPDDTWECPWAWEHSSLADRIFTPPPSA